MPELPEVQTIVSDLQKNILGYTIKKCDITKGYVALPTNMTFLNVVKNKKITNVERVAKNVLVHLNDNSIIQFHLAMTGQILLNDFKRNDTHRWLKVLFEIQKDAYEKYLIFNDMRMFGKVSIISNEQRKSLISKYGPEPIEQNITPQEFLDKIKSKRTNIKNALLDQSLVSGLGNIYATDALFLAGINPLKTTIEITNKEGEILLKSAKKVLLEGIKNRGATLSDKKYVDIFGNEGSYQHHFKIYSKQVCPKCNSKVEFKKINGRGTYFCPVCQK